MSRFFVYFLIKSERAIYVGHTKKLSTRIKSHKVQDFDYVRWVPVYGKDVALYYEKRWITRFKPERNIYGSKGKMKSNKVRNDISVKKNLKTYRVSLSISHLQYEKALKIAKDQERSLSNYISFCVVRGILNDRILRFKPFEKDIELRIVR